MAYRAYSFVPLSETMENVQPSIYPQKAYWFLESDLREMWFRDQFGGIYVFHQYKGWVSKAAYCTMFGFMAGFVIARLMG